MKAERRPLPARRQFPRLPGLLRPPIDLATKAGQVTNAVLGFTSMLVSCCVTTSRAAWRWPSTGPSRRFATKVERVQGATGPTRPTSSSPSSPWCATCSALSASSWWRRPGFEADDILATLATRARDAGRNVVVVSGDRDTFQLVEDPHVKVMYTRRGISDTVVYDEAGIWSATGCRRASTRCWPLCAGTLGQPPGVPGVGEKTAAKLVSTYGDLDGIFSHVAEQTPKLRQNLADHEAQVRRNAAGHPAGPRRAAPGGRRRLGVGKWDAEKVKGVFGELEFARRGSGSRRSWGAGTRRLPRSSAGRHLGSRSISREWRSSSPGGSKAASDA